MSHILTRLLYNSIIPIRFVILLSSCHTVADTGYLTSWGSGMQDYMMGWACRYIRDTTDAVKFLLRKHLALKCFKYWERDIRTALRCILVAKFVRSGFRFKWGKIMWNNKLPHELFWIYWGSAIKITVFRFIYGFVRTYSGDW